jgi:plasmid maintenance system antidote protein VapI
MTKSDLQTFLESRSAINVTAFCAEAGISKRYLDYILSGERTLTKETASKLLPVMEKYGWSRDK